LSSIAIKYTLIDIVVFDYITVPIIIIIIIIIIYGKKEFPDVKVHRKCPSVLTVKVDRRKCKALGSQEVNVAVCEWDKKCGYCRRRFCCYCNSFITKYLYLVIC